MRVNRCTASGKPHRYGRTASSGSVVQNDPVNKTDPTGNESAQLSLQGLAGIEADERNNPPNPTAAGIMVGVTIGAVAVAVAAPEVVAGIAAKGFQSVNTAIRNATVVNPKTGLTVNQTKAIANFFGKGVDGAKAVTNAASKEGFSLPKGVTEKTLQNYRDVANKAIEAGKPAEVQKARIEAIDKSLEALKRNQ